LGCGDLGRADAWASLFHFRHDWTTGPAGDHAFFVIAKDPARFWPMMIPSALEKLAFGIPAIALYIQRHVGSSDLALGCVDLLLGVLFLFASRLSAP